MGSTSSARPRAQRISSPSTLSGPIVPMPSVARFSISAMKPRIGVAQSSANGYTGLIDCSDFVGDFTRVMRKMRNMRISVVACVRRPYA